ncbi:hypothetical protein Mgra_00009847, partial [Meloidogyne graminicola]
NVNRHLHTEKHKKNVALQKAVEEKCLELFGESPEAGNNEEGEQTEEQTAAEGYGGYINEHIPQYPGYAENYTYPQYDYHTEELDQKTRQDSIIHYQAEEQARQRGQYNGQGSGSNVQGHDFQGYVLDFQNQLTYQQGFQDPQSGTRSQGRGSRHQHRTRLQSDPKGKGKIN